MSLLGVATFVRRPLTTARRIPSYSSLRAALAKSRLLYRPRPLCFGHDIRRSSGNSLASAHVSFSRGKSLASAYSRCNTASTRDAILAQMFQLCSSQVRKAVACTSPNPLEVSMAERSISGSPSRTPCKSYIYDFACQALNGPSLSLGVLSFPPRCLDFSDALRERSQRTLI